MINILRKIIFSSRLWLTALSILIICYFATLLGQTLTFLLFDIVLSICLATFFKSKWRVLFLLHPLVVFVTSLGFEIPYEDIGVGYTYINSYNVFIAATDNEIYSIGLKSSYIGVFPFLWIPNLLFTSKLGVLTYYYSMSLWNLFCGIFFTKVTMLTKSISNKTLFLLVLFFVISPMSLEINSSIHRYHLLILGVLLFYVSWVDLNKMKPTSRLFSYLILILSVILISISKLALLFSIIIFVFIDFILRKKVTLLKQLPNTFVFGVFCVFLGLIYFFGFYVLPQQYLYLDFVKGPINIFTQTPIIGYFARVVYSLFSPFPWLTFSQWFIYGGNEMFLLLHVFSAFISVWLVFSLFLNFKKILLLKHEHRAGIIMFLSISLSLSFSAVGHNVYIAPALPFLSIILLYRKFICNVFYPLVTIILAEILLFIT